MAEAKTVVSIIGRQTTAGAAEETIQLSLNGAAAANTLSVAAGTTLYISDLILGGLGAAGWKLQQANDGSTFFDIAGFDTPTNTGAGSGGTNIYSFYPALVVTGGANVVVRLRGTTAGGAAAVVATLRAYTEQ